MPDYKEMYLKMVRATERAMNVLIEAQQECEEMCLSGRPLMVFSGKETTSEPEDSPGADG